MEYRKIHKVSVSTLGLGSDELHETSSCEIERIINVALDNGINFMDTVMSNDSAALPIANALRGRRERMIMQFHLCATYPRHAYSRTQKLDKVKKGFTEELRKYGTDYADIGMIHFIDSERDFAKVFDGGVVDYAQKLKQDGVIRLLGFSSHTPAICKKLVETDIFDTFMLGINPAFDFEPKRGKLAISEERLALYQLCQKKGVAISVMKAFNGGQLLDAAISPFRHAMTVSQCIQYALDRPGVLTVLVGVTSVEQLNQCLSYYETSRELRDYAFIGDLPRRDIVGACVYCNHCLPCPSGINIGTVNKYADLAAVGDAIAAGHYRKLPKNAKDCTGCGVCESRCPFGVQIRERMRGINHVLHS